MTENRYRPSSPTGRRYADPRASTGMVISSSFDPARYSSSSQPRSAVDTFPVPRHGSVYSTQGVAKRQVLDDANRGGGSIVRTEYAVRPRNNSTLEPHRPASVSGFPDRRSSPPRVRPAIVSGSRDDPRSPTMVPKEERYLVPAASTNRHHHRHSSATRAEQGLIPARVNRQPEYHRRGGYNSYPQSASRGPSQDEGFSYTTPKEQFLSESSRPPQRRDSYSRRERPTSMIGIPEYRAPERRAVREGPPPSSTRALDRIERNEPPRQPSSRTSDTESEVPRRRHSTRAPVLHHYPEDGYSSSRDDRDVRALPRPRHDRPDDDDRAPKQRHRDEREREVVRELPRESDRVRERDRDRDRERDRERERERERDRDRERLREPDRPGKPRSRDSSPEHSGLRKGITAAAVGAVGAAAGAAINKARNKDDEDSETDGQKERKHRRRRHHHTGDEPSPDELGDRVDRDLKLTNGERDHRRKDDDRRGDDAENDEERRERRRHHRHRKHKDRAERDNESDTAEEYTGKEARHRIPDRDRDDEPLDVPRHHRDRAPSRDEDRDVPLMLEQRTISPGEDEDNRPRKVQLVEPAEKKEDFRPRGILKPPRAVPFPEDPNPTREGVAPLKDATKDGVPPNARWTKVSRALVNPEALEKAHERFEERDDYVIVLRVVSKEDIMKLAEKTKEIRGMCRRCIGVLESRTLTDLKSQKLESANGKPSLKRNAADGWKQGDTATRAQMNIVPTSEDHYLR